MQAKNNYNLDSLPGQQSQYSLESCIADCERGKYVLSVEATASSLTPYSSTVLNDVSAEGVAGNEIRDTAKVVRTKAQKLAKDLEYEEKRKRGMKSNSRPAESCKERPSFTQ